MAPKIAIVYVSLASGSYQLCSANPLCLPNTLILKSTQKPSALETNITLPVLDVRPHRPARSGRGKGD